MKKFIVLTVSICGLLTSCSSNKDSNSITPEVSQIMEESIQESMQPLFNIFALIYGYHERENKYPESPEFLIEYYKNITTNTVLNLDDYTVLEFKLTQTNTMEVIWEKSSEPFLRGSFFVTPESFIEPIDGSTRKEE